MLSFLYEIISKQDVVIGVPNWPSVRATAHVLKVVLEENLGVEVDSFSNAKRNMNEVLS